jgi:hypothetical protein
MRLCSLLLWIPQITILVHFPLPLPLAPSLLNHPSSVIGYPGERVIISCASSSSYFCGNYVHWYQLFPGTSHKLIIAIATDTQLPWLFFGLQVWQFGLCNHHWVAVMGLIMNMMQLQNSYSASGPWEIKENFLLLWLIWLSRLFLAPTWALLNCTWPYSRQPMTFSTLGHIWF